MKISDKESSLLFEKFFANPHKNDRSKTLAQRSMQEFWYNINKYPFTPYCDCQPLGFDPDPQTYQDVLVIQTRMIKEFFSNSGWITRFTEKML